VNTLNNGPASYASVFVRGQLLVADAGGAGTSAVSAYTVNADSTLNASEPPLVNGQTAACWIAANPRGEVFVANAGSPSISTYRVLPDGALGLFGNTALPVGVKPLDTAASTDGQDVYVIDAANHAIDAFAVGTNGQLSPVGQPTSIPAGAVGLAAS
jgi:DNA-binding beta-propeller fold protein YncE